MNKAVFIDKDGTLIRNVPYNVDPGLVILEDYAIAALKLLTENKYLLVIISNQSGVARGYFKESDLKAIRKKIQLDLLPFLIHIDGFYYCPHLPGGQISEYAVDCNCRKPRPGMIVKAAKELEIDIKRSWMIGDILHDVEAGNAAGCRTILLNNGNETEWLTGENRVPCFTVTNLLEAATIIVEEEKVEEERKTSKSYGKLA